METAIIFGVLLLVAFPVIAIVALVKAINTRDYVRQLERRIVALEASRAAAPIAAPEAAPAPPAPIVQPSPVIEPSPVVEPPPAAEPIAPAPPPSAIPAAAKKPAPPTSTSLEEKFGTKWVVWIGGLALALGGIFLVRYSIEQGLLGPGMRVFFGAVFAGLLITGGEWARRNDIATGAVAMPTQHIPSILTAAGTIAAYATVYAAFALYGFLSPPVAFILLGLVALATLAAALLHGPALAGLGLAGAFVTPVLIPSDTPNYWALYIYLAIVTAAAFALARTKLWRWLAVTAVALGALWTLPGVDFPHVDTLGAHLFHVMAGFALAAALIVSGLLFGPSAAPGQTDKISSGAIGAYLVAAALLAVGSFHDSAALAVFAFLTAATVAVAWRTEAALLAVPAAAALAALVMLQWCVPELFDELVKSSGVTAGAIPEPPTGTGMHLVLGALFAALFGLSGFAAQGRSDNPLASLLWSGTAVATPIAMLIALDVRVAAYDRSIPFALLALGLAALFGYATELLTKRPPRPGIAGSAAVFATGAVASLALALTFALDKGWLTVGLALMVPGIAWISEQRPLPALRKLAAVITGVVLLRVGYEPRIVGSDLGTTPIFNLLLYGYGVPALSFWTAGYLLRRRGDDAPVRTVESAAILFTVLLAMLEIRHYMNNGDLFRESTALAEIAMQVAVGFAMAIGLEWLRGRSKSVVHNVGALIIATLTLAAVMFGLAVTVNPYVTGRPVGGTFFNLILLGYGIPAVLAAILSLVARHSRSLSYRYIMAATAVALALAYFTLEVRLLFHGPFLARGVTTGAEQYAYSAVWLSFGVLLLIAGFLLRSQPARLASAAVVTLTIAKVFLVDMAGLEGIFRALSFIGLGGVLVGIGLLYQKLLFPPRVPAAETPGDTA